MSIDISEKALQDLEFTTVIQQVATFSISELGKKLSQDKAQWTELDSLDL